MANVIISKQHQAAPSIDVAALVRSRGIFDADTYDAELDSCAGTEDTSHLRRLERSPEQTVEMALEEFETSYMAADKQRWQGQERWRKELDAMRRGRVMHPYEFMRRLRSAGVDARVDEPPMETVWVEKVDSTDVEPFRVAVSDCRLWLNNWTRGGLIGVNASVPDPVTGRRMPKTITSIQYPYAQEYSVMRFDKYDVPTKERFRGWRTTLLVLITAGAITETEAVRAFGEPAQHEASAFYREQLQGNRAIRLGMVQ